MTKCISLINHREYFLFCFTLRLSSHLFLFLLFQYVTLPLLLGTFVSVGLCFFVGLSEAAVRQCKVLFRLHLFYSRHRSRKRKDFFLLVSESLSGEVLRTLFDSDNSTSPVNSEACSQSMFGSELSTLSLSLLSFCPTNRLRGGA